MHLRAKEGFCIAVWTACNIVVIWPETATYWQDFRRAFAQMEEVSDQIWQIFRMAQFSTFSGLKNGQLPEINLYYC